MSITEDLITHSIIKYIPQNEIHRYLQQNQLSKNIKEHYPYKLNIDTREYLNEEDITKIKKTVKNAMQFKNITCLKLDSPQEMTICMLSRASMERYINYVHQQSMWWTTNAAESEDSNEYYSTMERFGEVDMKSRISLKNTKKLTICRAYGRSHSQLILQALNEFQMFKPEYLKISMSYIDKTAIDAMPTLYESVKYIKIDWGVSLLTTVLKGFTKLEHLHVSLILDSRRNNIEFPQSLKRITLELFEEQTQSINTHLGICEITRNLMHAVRNIEKVNIIASRHTAQIVVEQMKFLDTPTNNMTITFDENDPNSLLSVSHYNSLIARFENINIILDNSTNNRNTILLIEEKYGQCVVRDKYHKKTDFTGISIFKTK